MKENKKKLSSLKEMQLKSYKNIKGGNAIDEMVFYEETGGGDSPTTRHLSTWNQTTGHYQCDHKNDYIK